MCAVAIDARGHFSNVRLVDRSCLLSLASSVFCSHSVLLILLLQCSTPVASKLLLERGVTWMVLP